MQLICKLSAVLGISRLQERSGMRSTGLTFLAWSVNLSIMCQQPQISFVLGAELVCCAMLSQRVGMFWETILRWAWHWIKNRMSGLFYLLCFWAAEWQRKHLECRFFSTYFSLDYIFQKRSDLSYTSCTEQCAFLGKNNISWLELAARSGIILYALFCSQATS